jgi:type 1 glutamine amidotransferase
MRIILSLIVAPAVAVMALMGSSTGAQAADAPFKLLVFSKTAAFRHDSIPTGIDAIKKIGPPNGFDVDASEDAGIMTAAMLKPYKVIVFLSTTWDILTDEQQAAFTAWYKAGHGWVGIHAAADCEYNWPWYGGLVGAYFKSHPAQQQAKITVVDKTFIATSFLPPIWERKDEWYNFRAQPKDVHVVLTIDESSYMPGPDGMGANHPMAWYHLYDGGRAFYTELGHTQESYADVLYLKHITGAILWAAGKGDPKRK